MSDSSTAASDARRRALTVWVAEHLPIRRIVLGVLTVALVLGVGIGTFRTLTLGLYSGSDWIDLIRSGVALGSVYALIALGYSLVYSILRLINFAHGEVFMAGSFASFFVARVFHESGFLDSNPWLAVIFLLGVSMAVSAGVAVLLERVAYRPLRGAPRLVPLITAIGASLFLQNTFRGFFGAQARGYPRPNVLDGTINVLGIQFPRTQFVVILMAIGALIGLSLFVSRTRTGKSMRAVAEDKEIAALMGINVDRVIMITFAIGGLMAGMAGVMFSMTFGVVQFNMGFLAGIKAFTAAVLGGIGSISGAALGGLLIGVFESVGPPLFLAGSHVPSPNQLRDVVAFVILVIVLIFRPGGILGTGEVEKV